MHLTHHNIDVTKVIFHDKLITDNGVSSDFIVFGQQGEYFGAHLIKGNKKQPTYDAMMLVSQPYEVKSGHCTRVTCFPTTKAPLDDSKRPVIIMGEDSYTQTAPQEDDFLGLMTNFETQVKKLIYLEANKLNP